VREQTAAAKTLYLGDGINDAPAVMAATVGMAIGHNSGVTAQAAGVVIMDRLLNPGQGYASQNINKEHKGLQPGRN
jgi:cation transport ATPase